MATLRITINLDNAPFADDRNAAVEFVLEHMLHDFADATSGKLRDENGNTVGEWTIEEEPQPVAG